MILGFFQKYSKGRNQRRINDRAHMPSLKKTTEGIIRTNKLENFTHYSIWKGITITFNRSFNSPFFDS